PPVLQLRFRAHRALEGPRLVGPGVRGVRLVDHRVGLPAGAHGRGARAPQGAEARAVRLPVARAHGSDRHARGEAEGHARGLIRTAAAVCGRFHARAGTGSAGGGPVPAASVAPGRVPWSIAESSSPLPVRWSPPASLPRSGGRLVPPRRPRARLLSGSTRCSMSSWRSASRRIPTLYLSSASIVRIS